MEDLPASTCEESTKKLDILEHLQKKYKVGVPRGNTELTEFYEARAKMSKAQIALEIRKNVSFHGVYRISDKMKKYKAKLARIQLELDNKDFQIGSL